ncbi:hypothetical protein BD289DRAFT_121301 [Coniella lustricola]|uniref:Uncharacterized protein n=1 Tax=Coniella lustricola TaxID=2025994 RepID=A0A2T2ZWK2_9PEZI|nr:hypothetical protein BD289DRAFT_121301 [Coniella lustricola]
MQCQTGSSKVRSSYTTAPLSRNEYLCNTLLSRRWSTSQSNEKHDVPDRNTRKCPDAPLRRTLAAHTTSAASCAPSCPLWQLHSPSCSLILKRRRLQPRRGPVGCGLVLKLTTDQCPRLSLRPSSLHDEPSICTRDAPRSVAARWATILSSQP